jgi:Protein of unknown function (DUF2934)
MNTDEAIRQRSYLIWKQEGCPEGRNLDHWLRAKAEVEAEPRSPGKKSRAAASPAVRKRKTANAS